MIIIWRKHLIITRLQRLKIPGTFHMHLQNPHRLSIRIEGESESSTLMKKQGFRASIDPWKLIKMSKEKAMAAADKARERLLNQKQTGHNDNEDLNLKPLPQETKSGPLMKNNKDDTTTAIISKPPFPSPRRRFSYSPTLSGTVPSPKQRYRSNFDLKLTQVSTELETYISRQVLCSVLTKDEAAATTPR